MQFLALATGVNSKGRKDGKYFCAEMFRAVGFWENASISYDFYVDKIRARLWGRRRKEVKAALVAANQGESAPYGFIAKDDFEPDGIETIMIFGHGTWKSLPAAGYNLHNVEELARVISRETLDVRIVLYCCSCGAGRGKYKAHDLELPSPWDTQVPNKAGFAMRLAGALVEQSVKFEIWAHLNRGKAAKNPFVVRIFERDDGCIVRKQVVPFVSWWRRKKDPAGRARWQAWRKLLSEHPTYRFEFPFRSQEEIDTKINTLAHIEDLKAEIKAEK